MLTPLNLLWLQTTLRELTEYSIMDIAFSWQWCSVLLILELRHSGKNSK